VGQVLLTVGIGCVLLSQVDELHDHACELVHHVFRHLFGHYVLLTLLLLFL